MKSWEPLGLSDIRGRYRERNSPEMWLARGLSLSGEAVSDWPLIDWDIAAKAADCFAIASAMCAGTAETAQQAQGQSPASATGEAGDAQPPAPTPESGAEA